MARVLIYHIVAACMLIMQSLFCLWSASLATKFAEQSICIPQARGRKIEIAIPADDASQVKKGHPVTVWIEGQEDRPLESVIERIHPRSEIRDALNIFVAELRFENPEETLRPGMKGVVRIDAEKRSLGWSLFHKPINYLRSRLTWW